MVLAARKEKKAHVPPAPQITDQARHRAPPNSIETGKCGELMANTW